MPNFLETLVDHVLKRVHKQQILANGNNNIGKEKKIMQLENDKHINTNNGIVNSNGAQNCNGVSVGTRA